MYSTLLCWIITLSVDASWQTGWGFPKYNHIVWIGHTEIFNEYLSIGTRFKDFRVLLKVGDHQRSKNIPEKNLYLPKKKAKCQYNSAPQDC